MQWVACMHEVVPWASDTVEQPWSGTIKFRQSCLGARLLTHLQQQLCHALLIYVLKPNILSQHGVHPGIDDPHCDQRCTTSPTWTIIPATSGDAAPQSNTARLWKGQCASKTARLQIRHSIYPHSYNCRQTRYITLTTHCWQNATNVIMYCCNVQRLNADLERHALQAFIAGHATLLTCEVLKTS